MAAHIWSDASGQSTWLSCLFWAFAQTLSLLLLLLHLLVHLGRGIASHLLPFHSFHSWLTSCKLPSPVDLFPSFFQNCSPAQLPLPGEATIISVLDGLHLVSRSYSCPTHCLPCIRGAIVSLYYFWGEWALWQHPLILVPTPPFSNTVSVTQKSSKYLAWLNYFWQLSYLAVLGNVSGPGKHLCKQGFSHWLLSLSFREHKSKRKFTFFFPNIPIYKPQLCQGQVWSFGQFTCTICFIKDNLFTFQEGFKPQSDFFQRPKALSHPVCHTPSGGSSGGVASSGG